MPDLDGFAKMSELLQGFAQAADPAVTKAAQAAGAEYFVEIMHRLSAPRGGGRKHMLDSIAYEQEDGETNVGWTLFYGRMVESGHKTVLGYRRKKTSSTTKAYALTTTAAKKRANVSTIRARPHMKPALDANREQIYSRMMAVYEGVMP